MKINKVIVTGNEGFVGRHLCKYLGNMGVTIVDMNQKFDVTRMEDLQQIGTTEAIIHLASKTSIGDSLSNPFQTYHTNLLGTLNLLEVARIKTIKKFINISTYVYGQPKYLPIDEKHPINPHSPYNKSKFIAEMLCENYSFDFGIDIVTLRPFYLYGPCAKPHSFIWSVIKQMKENRSVVLSGKNIRRDLLFISDFTNLIEAILSDFPDGYNVYNVGSGISNTLEEIVQIIGKLMDNKPPPFRYDLHIRPNDVSDMRADISKVSNEFHWKPAISLETGLELTLRNLWQ